MISCPPSTSPQHSPCTPSLNSPYTLPLYTPTPPPSLHSRLHSLSTSSPSPRGHLEAFPDGIPEVYLQWRMLRKNAIRFGVLELVLGPRRSELSAPVVSHHFCLYSILRWDGTGWDVKLYYDMICFLPHFKNFFGGPFFSFSSFFFFLFCVI